VQESAADLLLDYEAIETSAAPVILPGPTMLKLTPQPQMQYCRLHRRFEAESKQRQLKYIC